MENRCAESPVYCVQSGTWVMTWVVEEMRTAACTETWKWEAGMRQRENPRGDGAWRRSGRRSV